MEELSDLLDYYKKELKEILNSYHHMQSIQSV